MVTFSVPVKEGYFSFTVPQRSVLFAGSRRLYVSQEICKYLLTQFGEHGFSFYVGCAEGVDRSFRKALSLSGYRKKSFVACAFEERRKRSYGLYASVVVPDNISPKAALYRRTIWLVKRCSLVVLFPEHPYCKTWGKGSKLVFTSAMYHLKPVFVVADNPPKESCLYKVLASNLFGTVSGFWAVPHPVTEGGTCDDEY
jgi:hypothetical protein